MAQIFDWICIGKLNLPIDKVYPLVETAYAPKRIINYEAHGKDVLDLSC